MLLLDSLRRDHACHQFFDRCGAVELSRRVGSVDSMGGELVVSVLASQIGEEEEEDDDVVQGEAIFRPTWIPPARCKLQLLGPFFPPYGTCSMLGLRCPCRISVYKFFFCVNIYVLTFYVVQQTLLL